MDLLINTLASNLILFLFLPRQLLKKEIYTLAAQHIPELDFNLLASTVKLYANL